MKIEQNRFKVIADNTKPRPIYILLSISFCLIAAGYLIGYILISSPLLILNGDANCSFNQQTNDVTNACKLWSFAGTAQPRQISLAGLEPINSYIIVSGKFILNSSTKLKETQNFKVTVNSKLKSPTGAFKNEKIRNDKIVVMCYNSTRTCDVNNFVIVTGLDSRDYEIGINFDFLNDDRNQFSGTQIQVMTANKAYNAFSILIRLIFCLLSIVSLIVFCCQNSKCRDPKVRFERNLILLISVFLILYNDPMFVFTILYPSYFLLTISTMFQMSFYMFLLYFWMVMWWQIKIGSSQSVSKTVHFCSLTISFFIFVLIVIQSIIQDLFFLFKPAINNVQEWVNKLFKVGLGIFHSNCPCLCDSVCWHDYSDMFDLGTETLSFPKTSIFYVVFIVLHLLFFGVDLRSSLPSLCLWPSTSVTNFSFVEFLCLFTADGVG